jgi:sec-independent protein translocase protein TatC
MDDLVDRARTAVSAMGERADLPGMSLLEHLQELRKRLVYSLISVAVGFGLAYGFRERIAALMIAPITKALADNHLQTKLAYLNPMDPFNFFLKIGLFGGIILASPFILYQVWLFIAPGLYQHERRYVVPFMAATIGLFLAGAFFGYRYVYPGALTFLIGYGSQFKPVVTIGEYMELFSTVILGLGIVFELPILVFFLSLFGIVSAKWLWKNIRYAILVIFIIAGIITPTPDPLSMCIFAAPMLLLYLLSIGIAHMVHPDRRNRLKNAKQGA